MGLIATGKQFGYKCCCIDASQVFDKCFGTFAAFSSYLSARTYGFPFLYSFPFHPARFALLHLAIWRVAAGPFEFEFEETPGGLTEAAVRELVWEEVCGADSSMGVSVRHGGDDSAWG